MNSVIFPQPSWTLAAGSSPMKPLSGPPLRSSRRIGDDGTPDGWRYTVDETIYGSFSNIPFDGQKLKYRLLAADAAERPRVRATLFGRTCDSADCLAADIELPELRLGDRLAVASMGAYTVVSASEFNGFPCPKRMYQ